MTPILVSAGSSQDQTELGIFSPGWLDMSSGKLTCAFVSLTLLTPDLQASYKISETCSRKDKFHTSSA